MIFGIEEGGTEKRCPNWYVIGGSDDREAWGSNPMAACLCLYDAQVTK